MALYTQKDWKLAIVKDVGFKVERDMQRLAETNLDELFGLVFIASEFQLNNLRIDTLAYDSESSSFVIIEFKRGSSYSVVDQGFAYLSLLLNNKADFILKYIDQVWQYLKIADVDWSATRVIFVADSFTRYQQEAMNFKDLPIELWEMKQYNNSVVSVSQLMISRNSESIKTLSRRNGQSVTNSPVSIVEKEIVTYDEAYHFSWGTDFSIELYQKLKDFAFEIKPDLTVQFKKLYIAFKYGKRNVFDIKLQKSGLKIWINKKYWELSDPFGISQNVASIGHHWNGEYQISFESESDAQKIFELIRQALDV